MTTLETNIGGKRSSPTSESDKNAGATSGLSQFNLLISLRSPSSLRAVVHSVRFIICKVLHQAESFLFPFVFVIRKKKFRFFLFLKIILFSLMKLPFNVFESQIWVKILDIQMWMSKSYILFCCREIT